MYSDQDMGYQDIAEVQLRRIRMDSPTACAALEKIQPYGWKVLYEAAFTVVLYKSMLDFMGGVPERFNYYRFIHEYPEIIPYVDQAINCLLEDWLYERAPC